MRIDNGSNPVASNTPKQPAASSKSLGSNAGGGSGANSLASVELNKVDGLLQLIVSANQTRDSLLQEVKIKMQNGELLTKQAALDTATSILNL